MAAITKQQAIDRLAQAVKQAQPDDLVEIYNELFPGKPATEDVANEDPTALVKKIVAHNTQSGDDIIQVAQGVTADANLKAGSGSDVLDYEGSGSATLTGGSGADLLEGGSGTT